jgi:hypothetical protein
LLHRARLSFRRAWERVEGWALAPVFALRSPFGQRSEVSCAGAAGGHGLIGITHSLTAMERAVTGVVIAAVALTGMPSEPSRPAASSPSHRAPVAGPQAPGGRDARDLLPSDRASAVSARDEAGALDDVLALAAKARETAEPQEGGSEPPSGDDDGGGEDDPPLGGPAAQRTKKAVDTGKKVAERIDQTLTDH